MCEVARRVSGFPRERVIGMAGVLDAARMRWFIADELKVSVEDVDAFVLGGHGDTMVPLPRYATVNGMPLPQLLAAERIEAINDRTRNGGIEIVNYYKTGSAYYAPAASSYEMVAAILHDKKKILPCAVYLQGEYGFNDLFVGVPCQLGHGGMERVIELKLTVEEKAELDKSAEAVRELVAGLPERLSRRAPQPRCGVPYSSPPAARSPCATPTADRLACLGLAGGRLAVWAFPRAFPFLPRALEGHQQEAVAIALERLRDLGEPVEDPYVVARLGSATCSSAGCSSPCRRRRPRAAATEHARPGAQRLAGLRLPARGAARGLDLPGARPPRRRAARAAPAPRSRGAGPPIRQQEARQRADAFLTEQGIDLSRYGEPEVRAASSSPAAPT